MTLGKWLIFIGLGIMVLGVLVWGLGKLHLPIGKLPGDIAVKKEKVSIYFPIVTSLILSVLFTIILNILIWIFKK